VGFLLLAADTTTTTAPNVTAKNPILPQGNEILWGTISFLVVLALVGRERLSGGMRGLLARVIRR